MKLWSCLLFLPFVMSGTTVNRDQLYPSCLQDDITWDTSDILDTLSNMETPEECQTHCQGDCKAFTWLSPNASTFHNLCVLFSSAMQEVPCTECVSGPAECTCSMKG